MGKAQSSGHYLATTNWTNEVSKVENYDKKYTPGAYDFNMSTDKSEFWNMPASVLSYEQLSSRCEFRCPLPTTSQVVIEISGGQWIIGGLQPSQDVLTYEKLTGAQTRKPITGLVL